MAVFAFVALAAVAFSTNAWENPIVNSHNRLPPRTYSVPLASAREAFTTNLVPASPYVISLNGTWKISWSGHPSLAVGGFEKVGFDDSSWSEIDVPSCVEMRGFGSPGYTNANYPFKREAMPFIRDRYTGADNYNPVSSYRRHFVIPENWKGRKVVLRFDGVASAYDVWVNGRKVGYAEDSMLPSEFDVTRFVGSGDNQLAVRVYRWCDGSFLEDQDMFRFSGIFRDVSVWSMPEDGIWDFAVRTIPMEGYEKWKLEVKVEGGQRMELSLYDADRKKVGELTPLSPSTYSLHLCAPRMWSAEKPYLYTLVLRKGDDIRTKRIGFREVRCEGRRVLVNGVPVKFHGVNRHEASPANGRTVSPAEMIRDITLMKRYNIDTVRTSHYPNHHLWYDLCDRYGIYVVAEANVEANEMPLYNDTPEGLGSLPDWKAAVVERNVRQVGFYRNHPSVVMWSMGNESGHGPNFKAAIAEVRRLDPSRLIHWERGNVDADVDSMMYPSVGQVAYRGKWGCGLVKDPFRNGDCPSTANDAGKPFFICEYAHAMGNALGNLQEYWDVINRYDSLIGGCIWDWIDQAVWRYTDKVDPQTGRRERYLAYGGDFDESPQDGPFCINGIIDPFRRVTPKLVEVGQVHRKLVVTQAKDGGLLLENRFSFTAADRFGGRWELLRNGTSVRRGSFVPPRVAPQAKGRLGAIDFGELEAGAEYFVNIDFVLRETTAWAGKGWPVARNQIRLSGEWQFDKTRISGRPEIAERADAIEVTAGPTRAVFSRATGTLSELAMNGRVILRDLADGVVAGPRFTCMRAFTDNDRWLRDGGWSYVDHGKPGFYSCGLSQLRYHPAPLEVLRDGIRSSVEITGSRTAGFTHVAEWRFSDGGIVEIANRVVPHGDFPPALPRIGLSLKLDSALENLSYYGRGPHENYIDRKTGSFFGNWTSTVTGQYVPYVRPQDCGYRCDVRWVDFYADDGRGVRFTSSDPLYVQALHYDVEELDFARHRSGSSRSRGQLLPVPEVRLNLDLRQLGLGNGSCGPCTLPQYRFPIKEEAWTVRMTPIDRKDKK